MSRGGRFIKIIYNWTWKLGCPHQMLDLVGHLFLWLDTFRMPNLSMSMYFYYGMNRADAEEVLGTGQEHFS